MTITNEELEALISKAAKKAVNEYAQAKEKEAKSRKYHNTFLLMKSYRDAAFHVENAVSEATQLDAGAGTQTQTYLRSVRKSKFTTMIMLAHIDKTLEEIKRRHEENGRACEYEAFEMYFMQGMTYEEIAEALNAGKNTPRRWISGIINEMSVLLWGIDEDRIINE